MKRKETQSKTLEEHNVGVGRDEVLDALKKAAKPVKKKDTKKTER